MVQGDLVPLNLALVPMPLVELNMGQVEHVRQGRQIVVRDELTETIVGLVDDERNVIGIGRVVGNKVQPECVIPLEAMSE